jgi:diguanylate cyclase (GGDEF)-like protein/PAS domain S-box-containing protein
VNKPVRLLLVEDSPDDVVLALRALRRGGFEPAHRCVQTAAELKSALAEESWDAIISDYAMPGFTGSDALAIFRATGLDIPFILVSGTMGETTAVEAMKAGASDYIMKQSLARLGPALERELKEAQNRAAHRLSQRELIESEARFRSLTLLSSDWYWEQDAEFRFTKTSDKFVDSANSLLSASGEALGPKNLGKTRWELPYRNMSEQQWAGHRALLEAHLPFRNLEFQQDTDSKTVRHVSISGEPTFDAEGRFSGYRGVGRDISEQVARIDDLRRLRAGIDAAADGIYLIDHGSMRFIYINDAACRFLDLEREAMLAMRVWEAIPIPRAELERSYDALIAGNKDAIPQEVLHTRADGTQIWLEVRRHANLTGGRWMIISLVRDISSRKQAEQVLHDSELRFRQMAEKISDVFFLQNLDSTQMYYVSPAYETIWGRTCESLYTRPASWGDAIHPDDRESAFAKYKAGRNTGFDYEFRILRPGGAVRWIHVRGFPVLDDAGQTYRIAGVASDITEQRRDAIRIKRLNRVYAVLSGINMLIVHVTDHETLYREACRIALEAGEFRFAWIGIPNRATRVFEAAAWAGDESYASLPRPATGGTKSGGAGLAATAMATARHVLCNDIEKFPGMLVHPDEALARGFRSAIALPLTVDGEPVGVMVLNAGEPDFFDELEIALLNELAGDISFAIENIDRRQKLARLARTRAISSEINSTIVRIRDRDELFAEVCRIVVERGGCRIAWIGLADLDAMMIVPIASAGGEPRFLETVRNRFTLRADAPLGNTMSARAIREKKAIVSNDIRNDKNVILANDHLKRGILSLAVLPLIIADEAAGVLILYAGEAGFFDTDELSLLTEMAGNVAFAMDHIAKREQLDYLAYYDALTGLANRKLFLERVSQYMRVANKGGHQLALVLLDLERFGNINDSLGRAGGDAILRQVAELMTKNEGDANLLARVGADQFAVVMPQVREESDVARHLQKSGQVFRDHEFRVNDAVYRLAARVGVAVFPNDGGDADTMFRNAEAALKKAKASGERFLFYTEAMTEKAAGTLTLENQLRKALDQQEFVLHYQPKVNLESGKVTGAEALIRWNDPRTGLVPPGRFIPVLEETGLIYEVGRWALRKVIEDHLRWRNAGLGAVRIAVNVSSLQLRDRGFVSEIGQLIGVDGNAAAGLELEIAESLIMEDVQHNIASFAAIGEMGVHIAIDDFGTGFSSLSHLSRLPVNALKIDRSFVTGMTEGPQGLALVSTIINLARSLKLKVVAEGVETEEQSRLLRLLRCDEIQGYLFSEPVSIETFEKGFLAPLAYA